MEDFYMNITSQNNSYDYSNITSDYSNITSNYSNITFDLINITFSLINITPNISSSDSSYYEEYYEEDPGILTADYYDDSSFALFSSNSPSEYSTIPSNYSNITSNYSNMTVYYKDVRLIMDVVTCIFIAVGLPLTLMAICALYSLVGNDHVAPIYVINLLISDLIQLCCMISEVARPADQLIDDIFRYIHLFALVASVGFMVCVALERYLVIAHPLWYRFRRTIKISIGVCVLVWLLALVLVLNFYFWFTFQVIRIIFGIFLLLPFPLFIFFLGGVLKALSTSISVSSDEKRRIMGILVLVLLIYTLLFLPGTIFFLKERNIKHFTLHKLSFTFVKFSPLADLALYVFMRKGIIDKVLASVCLCRTGQDSSNTTIISV